MIHKTVLARAISILAVAAIVLLCPVLAGAAEGENQNELQDLFRFSIVANDGEIEGVHYRLYHYFLDDPQGFILLLSGETQEIQKKVVELVITEAYYFDSRGFDAFPGVVYSVRLGDNANDAACWILEQLESEVAKLWGVPNPKTGDPVVFIAAALVLSGAGGAVLLDKRKKEN